MSSTHARRDFWDKWDEPTLDTAGRAAGPREVRAAPVPSKRGPRAMRGFVRFLITLGLGVGGTLAWQSYGDTAREMIAATDPRLAWLAPETPAPPPVAPTRSAAPATVASAAPMPSADSQQINRVWLNLADVRKSVDDLAAEVAASRQQTADEIGKLQASAQDILTRMSAPPPRPAPPPARKPALAPAPAPAPAR